MNLFDLGGQYLRVCRAITPPDTNNQVSMTHVVHAEANFRFVYNAMGSNLFF